MYCNTAVQQQAADEFAQTLSSAVSVFLLKLSQQQQQQLQLQYQQQHVRHTRPHPHHLQPEQFSSSGVSYQHSQPSPIQHQHPYSAAHSLQPHHDMLPSQHPESGLHQPQRSETLFETKCGFTQCKCSQDRSTATGAFLHMLACEYRPIHDVSFSQQVLEHLTAFSRAPITGNHLCCYCGKVYSEDERSSKKRCSIGRHKKRCLPRVLQLLKDPSKQDKVAADLQKVWRKLVRRDRKTDHGRATLVIDPRLKSPRQQHPKFSVQPDFQPPQVQESVSSSLSGSSSSMTSIWYANSSLEAGDNFPWNSSQESLLSESEIMSDH